MLGVLLLSLILPCLLKGDVPADEIKSLPGWSGALPTRQYSGYISVDEKNGRYLHYWFVLSEVDPSSAPVVMWMNGGPGCSSLDGYFYEQGPLHFSDNWQNETVPTLVANPYAWNKIANMLFVEAPAGVGFSYSDTKSDYNTNDNKTANDNFVFLMNWFKAYSEYAKNDFYISGESYAGIYVPTLAWNILTRNNSINMRGFMVGNGCHGNDVGACSYHRYQYEIEFLHGHGLYSEILYQEAKKVCNNTMISHECFLVYQKIIEEVSSVNIYDIYFPCINDQVNVEPRYRVRTKGTSELEGLKLATCIDGGAAKKYLNIPDVRKAIHVQPESTIGEWHVCTSKINYDGNVGSLIPGYPTLIKNYRVLIYNGDVDACVPYNDNEEWTSSLNIEVSEKWRAWYVDDQVAGYVTTYSLNNFAFITVKGSGHMVPQFRPKQALAMFERYLQKMPF